MWSLYHRLVFRYFSDMSHAQFHAELLAFANEVARSARTTPAPSREDRRRMRQEAVEDERIWRDVDKLVAQLKTLCGPAYPLVMEYVDDDDLMLLRLQ